MRSGSVVGIHMGVVRERGGEREMQRFSIPSFSLMGKYFYFIFCFWVPLFSIRFYRGERE